MATLAALVPPVIAAAAFVAIAIGIKRFTEREEREDRAAQSERAASRDHGKHGGADDRPVDKG